MLEHLIHGDWHDLLADEMQCKYFKSIEDSLLREAVCNEICPSIDDLFQAFNLCQYKDTRVVIVGQDPYITPGISDGLAFSANPNVRVPASLLNVFKALKNDMGCYIPNNGCLKPWASQGVLLLNSVLSVRASCSRSHYSFGWEMFTDAVISILNKHERSLVFMLWGSLAKRKSKLIDHNSHLVLTANHPSPIIACNTFTTCNHFSTANMFLYETSPVTIDWQIPNIERSQVDG